MRILMFVSMMLWGLTWTASKIMVDQNVPLFQIIFIKSGIVTLSFIPIMLYLKISFLLPKKSILPIISVGIFNTIYAYLIVAGLKLGEAGNAGVIAEVLAPLFGTLFWVILKKTTLLGKEKIGLFLGFVSGCFLVDVSNFDILFSKFNFIYVLAAAVWGGIMISSRYASDGSDPIVINFYSTMFPFIIFSPSILLQDTQALYQTDWKFWLAMFSVTILSTTFATTIFYKGVKVLGVTQGGIFVLLVPIGALFFAWLFLSETPQLHTIIGGLIALFAIYLINYFRPKSKKSLKK